MHRSTERFTAHLSRTLINRARNAVYWTPGLTLTKLAEEALAEKIDRIEAERGETFPQRTGEVRVGRPVKMRG